MQACNTPWGPHARAAARATGSFSAPIICCPCRTLRHDLNNGVTSVAQELSFEVRLLWGRLLWGRLLWGLLLWGRLVWELLMCTRMRVQSRGPFRGGCCCGVDLLLAQGARVGWAATCGQCMAGHSM